MPPRMKGWLAGAAVAVGLLVLTWLAPLRELDGSGKVQAVLALFDAGIQPVIDAVGKAPVLGLLGALALFCLWRAQAPSMAKVSAIRLPRGQVRAPADEAPVLMQRKRDLGRIAKVAEEEPSGPLGDGSDDPTPPAEPHSFVERADPAEPEFALVSDQGAPPHESASAAPEDDPLDRRAANHLGVGERMIVEFLAASLWLEKSVSRPLMAEKLRSLKGADAQLSDETYEKTMALLARQRKQSTPHGEKVRPVVLARKPRDRARDWSGDRSWFGGLPRLGGAAWPAGADGVPLPFAAQIDLAELAAACPESPLAHEGALAFFLNQGAVVYVEPGEHGFTPAPAGLPLAYDEGSYPFPERPSRASRELFPFWPVDLVGLDLPADLPDPSEEDDVNELIYEAQHAALNELIPSREYSFSVSSAREEGVAGADRLWWYGAFYMLDRLRDGVDGVERAVAVRNQWIEQARGYQAKLAAAAEPKEDEIARSRADEERHRAQIPEIHRQGAALDTFVGHVEAFVAGHDAWSVMNEDEVALLKDIMGEARKEFPDLSHGVPIRLDDVRNVCIRRMITGESEAFAALPDDLLDFINERYRLTTQSPHQMFGLAGVKQHALYDHLCDHLLLQLGYDDMNEWRFGDMGLWQFWISPADAAAGRWDKTQLTFECA